jgi:hypothetical protein
VRLRGILVFKRCVCRRMERHWDDGSGMELVEYDARMMFNRDFSATRFRPRRQHLRLHCPKASGIGST